MRRLLSILVLLLFCDLLSAQERVFMLKATVSDTDTIALNFTPNSALMGGNWNNVIVSTSSSVMLTDLKYLTSGANSGVSIQISQIGATGTQSTCPSDGVFPLGVGARYVSKSDGNIVLNFAGLITGKTYKYLHYAGRLTSNRISTITADTGESDGFNINNNCDLYAEITFTVVSGGVKTLTITSTTSTRDILAGYLIKTN